MPSLNFITARVIDNPGKTTVAYYYTINDDVKEHRVRVVGIIDQPAFNEEELHDYTQKLFSVALNGIETLWDASKELPQQDVEFKEQTNLPTQDMKAIPWEGYRLELK